MRARQRVIDRNIANKVYRSWMFRGLITGNETEDEILHNRTLTVPFCNDLAEGTLCKVPNSPLNKYGGQYGISDLDMRNIYRFKRNQNAKFASESWYYWQDTDRFRQNTQNAMALVRNRSKRIIRLMHFA